MKFKENLTLSSQSSLVQQLFLMPRIDANRQAATAALATVDSVNPRSVLNDRSLRICRNLFGPVDHEYNAKFLSDQLSCIRKESAQRWNFDFQNETPIPGRFEWTPVLVEPRSPPTGDTAVAPTIESKVKHDPDAESSSCHSHQQSSIVQSQIDPITEVPFTAPSLRQTKITDHMPKQKRSRQGFQDAGDRVVGKASKLKCAKRPRSQQTATNSREAE
ncbi:hypothetical protein CHUAL_000402 [Chamberlinius hualienensis]